MTFTHGASGYRNHGCHCASCTEGHREQQAAWRARVRMAASLKPGDPRHGTVNGYSNYGCRCLACTEARAASSRQYDAWVKSRPA